MNFFSERQLNFRRQPREKFFRRARADCPSSEKGKRQRDEFDCRRVDELHQKIRGQQNKKPFDEFAQRNFAEDFSFGLHERDYFNDLLKVFD